MGIEIGRNLIEAALGRAMTYQEWETAQSYSALAASAFLTEAFGTSTDYGFGTGTATQRLRVDGGTVTLPYRRVTAVEQVTDDNDHPVTYRWKKNRPQYLQTSSRRFVTVTYRWQLDMPESVPKLLAGTVARALQASPEAKQGAQSISKTVGPFSGSIQFATWAVGGQVMLSPEEKRAAKQFSPISSPHSWLFG